MSAPGPAAVDLSPRGYDRALRRVGLALVAVGVFARLVRYAVNGPLWGDEAMVALNFATRDFAGLTRTLDHNQVAPVLFLWAERAVLLLLGDGEWALRLLPLLAGLAALAAFWDFARRTVSPTAAVLAVGLLAVARWPVSMAGTAKPYAGDLFWAAALFALAARWQQRPDRLWPLALLAAVAPVAVASSYPSVFVAGAVSVYLLPVAWRHPDRRAKAAYAAYNLLLVGTFAACFLLVGREQLGPAGQSVGRFMADYWGHGFPPADPAGAALWSLDALTGRMFAYPIGDKNGGSTLTFLLFAAGAWRTWRAGNRPLVVLCLTPFALNAAAAAVHAYPFGGGCARVSQHLGPAVCLLAGVGWARLHGWVAPGRSARLRWVYAAAAVLAAYGVALVLHDAAFSDHDPGARWSRGLARELRRHLRPGDRVVYAPGPAMHEETGWHLHRFRDRMFPEGSVPTPAEVPGRLWVLVPTATRPAGEPEALYLARLRGVGWVPAADVTYRYYHRDKSGDDRWYGCRVVCLYGPGEPSDPPVLSAFP